MITFAINWPEKNSLKIATRAIVNKHLLGNVVHTKKSMKAKSGEYGRNAHLFLQLGCPYRWRISHTFRDHTLPKNTWPR